MTHELILTSVSQGLEKDSRGFCAVAEDRDIPRYLRMRLETLSGYEHLFPPDSEEYPLQPVVYSHLIFPDQDTTWHALSRIGDAGIDFQSQPNRLAHHVVLDADEFVPEGPAWPLALPGFHLTEWLTPAVRFIRGRPIPRLTAPPPLTRRQRIARERRWVDLKKMRPTHDREEMDPETIRRIVRENEEQVVIARPPSSPCPSWREMTGDEGWGGVLAETIRTGQEAVILFRPGQNLLPLFYEALSLLPASFQWRGSFSTWYTHLPEHVACHWKGVLAGSLLASQLLQDRNLLVIDLTRPMGTAPTGPYVEFARTGIDGTLPSDETEESPFLSGADEDTKPFESAEAPASAAQDEKPEPAPAPPEAAHIPPIVIEESPKVRVRSRTSEGVFGKLLNMRSRSQFYLLYGITFLLVLLLLVLVLDQVVDFGLMRWFQGSGKGQKPAAVAGAKTPKPDAAKPTPPEADRPDPAAIQEERNRKRNEERERQRAARQQQRELLAKAKSLRADFGKRKGRDREALDLFLLDCTMPPHLALPIPTVNGNLVDPPPPKSFAELAPLYRYGLALELNYISLLEIPNVRIETRKREFTRSLRDELPTEPDGAASTESKLGESTDDVEKTGPESPEQDYTVPDTERFEWDVLAVDTETQRETPMFEVKLTSEGLEFAWQPVGMTTQHLYDTLTASLGFLRIGVENETNMSKIRSIALFEPRTDKPVLPAECFADPEKPEFEIPTPFAVEPWKSMFETIPPNYGFRLEVTVSPDTVAVSEDEDSETPSRFLGRFETEIQSTRQGQKGALTYEPIEIAIEGLVGPDRLTWTDRFPDRLEELKKELEDGTPQLTELKQELDQIKSTILNNPPNVAELRKRRTELTVQIDVLDNRLKQSRDIAAKLPEAHTKLLGNAALRFDYSVYLFPVFEDPDADHARLRNEESLLIMQTIRERKPEEQKTLEPDDAEGEPAEKDEEPEE